MRKKFILKKSKPKPINKKNDEISVNLILEGCNEKENIKPNIIFGKVINKYTNKSLSNVCIKLMDENYTPLYHEYTNENGVFYFCKHIPKDIFIVACKEGYITYSKSYCSDNFTESKEILISMESSCKHGATVVGFVKDENCNDVTGIQVILVNKLNSKIYSSTSTSKEGLFILENISCGNYYLGFYSDTHSNTQKSIEVKDDTNILNLETIFVNSKILKGTVSGVIVDNKKEPIENALVVLFNSKTNTPISTTYTNEKGVYLFYNLEEASYYIVAK